jgi:group II intron reverse transcriptase/maturase
MQNAATVLNVIQQRGRQGLPLERLYRQLYNRELYLLAYAKLYPNKGALTPGSNADTIDGMSLRRIDKIIEAVKEERYQWTPVRRTYIPKNRGEGSRPLGLPAWSDKLLQEVMRMLLEAYYEPQFSPHAHGFRPKRGCQTALIQLSQGCIGTKWFIEGDIAKCFDSLSHQLMLEILQEKIHDGRFIRLLKHLLQAGYLEDWQWHETQSGAPQGGVLIPLLSNIYLNKFDQFVEEKLIPAYTKGETRARNPAYQRLAVQRAIARKNGDRVAANLVLKQMRELPSLDPQDAGYRRLRYNRYCDDFILAFVGPKREAQAIKQQIADYLRDEMALTLSKTKTLITHATSEKARYLGYDIKVKHTDSKIGVVKRHNHRFKTRVVNGIVGLWMPKEALARMCSRYTRGGRPVQRTAFIQHSDFDIIAAYQMEYRGYVQYYLMAHNVAQLAKLKWVMQTSLLKTLATKYKTSVTQLAQRYKAEIGTPYGPMKGLRVIVKRDGKAPLVAEFGGIPLRRQRTPSTITDKLATLHTGRSELITRLLAEQCEMCGSTADIEVHHIRKLADLKVKGRREKPLWIQRMAAMRRKTLIVCHACHVAITHGRSRTEWQRWKNELESRVLAN